MVFIPIKIFDPGGLGEKGGGGRGAGGLAYERGEDRMLDGHFELNPQRRPIWAWSKILLTPKS